MMAEYLGPDEVAEVLHISSKTARKLMRDMPHMVIGGTQRQTIRVTRQALENYLRERVVYPVRPGKRKGKTA